jgi:uncharacterized protein (TIGR03437 family)
MRSFLRTTLFALCGVAHAADAAYTIATVAGSDWVGDGGPASQAVLFQAEGVAVDSSGNLYIADALANRVRQVSLAGVIRTVAGTGIRGFSGDGAAATAAQLNSPYGLSLDHAGNLYIADLGNARVRKVTTAGIISTVAGSTPGAGALAAPRNLAFDSAGNLYVSDFAGHKILRVNLDGSLTTVAGAGIPGYSGDGGPALKAQLSYPTALAFDRYDNLYIGDSQNHAIRRITGGMASGVMGTLARVATPTGLAFDASGTLQVADPSGGQILRIPPSGQTTAIGVVARDVAIAPNGALLASAGTLVHRIEPSGILTIAAGGGNPAYGDQADARAARLNHPSGVAVDAVGNLYIADRDNHRIRRVATSGIITTIAGTGQPGDSGDGGPAFLAQINAPSSVTLDAAGNLYIADTGNHRVRRITPQGVMLPVSSAVTPVYALADNGGSIYISDQATGKILKAIAPGPPSPSVAIPILEGLQSPQGLALDATGNLYIAETGAGRVRELSPAGVLTSIGSGWNTPRGVAVDNSSNLYIADAGLGQIVRLDASGGLLPIAGSGAAGFSGDSDAALLAQLGLPWDIAAGADGKLYTADLDNNRIRMLTPALSVPSSPVTLADAVNAVNFQAGPIVPGMLVAIRGANITAAEVLEAQILFGGLPAQLVLIESARLLVVAPLRIPVEGSISIEVRYKGSLRAAIPAAVAASAPVLSAPNPATQASVVSLFGTGLGSPGLPVTVQIGDQPAEVLYAGPTAAYPGIFQINVRIPASIPVGITTVVVTSGAASSPPTPIEISQPRP